MNEYPKFNLGDKVLSTCYTDLDPPNDKITDFGIVSGYYYQDCDSAFESPLNYKGWVYIVKVYKCIPSDSRLKTSTLDMFKEDELSLQIKLKVIG